jgi:hypothetical protein
MIEIRCLRSPPPARVAQPRSLDAMRATLMQSAICSGLLILLSTTSALAQIAPSAPSDQPKALTQEQIPDNIKAIAPYVAMARKSYPSARQRFLSGLSRGQNLFLVTRLVDATGHWEQVFIHVETIVDEQITGTIAS